LTAFNTDTPQDKSNNIRTLKREYKSVSIAFDQHIEAWQIINDSVMGGLSNGHIEIESDNNTLITDKTNVAVNFLGHIFTENNGGFSSVYTKSPKLTSAISSVQIIIKGDGHRYQLRVKSKIMEYEIAYKVEFITTADKVDILRFNLADFQATFRGKNIDNSPKLNANNISHIGFLINNKQATDFALSIQAIEFFNE